MLLVSAVAVTGFGLPLALSVRARNYDDALLTLAKEAASAAATVPGSFERDNDVPELPDPVANVDVALYGKDGRRVLGEGPATADAHVEAVLRSGTAQQSRGDLVVAVPISDEESVVGAIRTSIDDAVVTSRTLRSWAAMAALAVGVLAIAGLLASRRSRSLALPLAQLRDAADVIGAGGEVPIRASSGIPEIDSVHDALAQAATRLNAAMARERELSADLAHQMRTPLASLRIRLESEQTTTEHDGGLVNDALRDVDRLEQTIDDVLFMARDAERPREPHPLATLIRETASHWEPRLLAAGRSFNLDVERSLPWVHASPQAIRQILDVLIDNAVIHGAGPIGLAASRLGEGAVIAVSDQGATTVDPAQVFVRRNDDARGEGIGLALARRLAEAEALRLVVADSGPGVVFHLVFGGPAPLPKPPHAHT
ncbi:MAG: sensor histidine kinase [Microthrixaceae bacterium]